MSKCERQESVKLLSYNQNHITPAILEEIETPMPDEFMQPDAVEELLPMRGISIGD